MRALEGLLFRRQFLLGPRFAERFPSWQRVAFGSLCITAHPDLPVLQVSRGAKSIALLGYLIDPRDPAADDRRILERLPADLDSLPAATASLGGRWVLLASDGARTLLFADAAGLRQVFHAQGWCASRPALLAEVLPLAPDPGAAAFMQSERYRESQITTWFPGDTTPYQGARMLLPNHLLDPGTGEVRRYWPDREVAPVTLADGIARARELLTGLVQAAAIRFPLALGLTAGWDSRLLLAATRGMEREVTFFTIRSPMTENDRDVLLPQRLLARLGLPHQLIEAGAPDPAFEEIYRRSVVTAHPGYASAVQAMLEQLPERSVCLKGDVAEVVKCYFRGPPATAGSLASLTGMAGDPFALREFGRWLAQAPPRNLPLLDLFCWEQEQGSYTALVQAECDIAQEAFTPFNCRELLVTLLGVPERHRRKPRFELFRALIEAMWPEVLREPVNGWPQVGFKGAALDLAERMGLVGLAPQRLRSLARKLLAP